MTTPGPVAAPPERWRALLFIAVAQVGAMSTWFSAAAVSPALAREWNLSGPQLGAVAVAVQLGFVSGALLSGIVGLTDLLSPRRVFALAALAAAVANGLLVASDGDFPRVLILRFVLGACLAGVYPTGMQLVAGWFRSERGLAIGTIVGALTLGTALPHLLASLGVASAWQSIILTTSGGALLAAAIATLLVRQGPFAAPSARLDLAQASRTLRNPAIRLATLGYLGHMWELYAMWTWVPTFLQASFLQSAGGAADPSVARVASAASAGVIAAGAVGCVAAGLAADRVGRTAITSAAMVVSGTSAVVTGLLFGQAPALLLIVATVWGISVIADSAQFSASVSELAPPEHTGSALALQTALGFLLAAISIQALPVAVGVIGWQGAFMLLAIGPALGTAAMLRLRARPESVRLAGGRR